MTTSVPASPGAAGPDGAVGQRLRAADVLLADRGQLFRALFLSAPVAQAVVDAAGRMLVVNPALCELTGRTSGELVGQHLDLLTHPDDVPLADLAAEHLPGTVLLDPQLQVLGERRLQRADGETIWAEQSRELIHRTTGELHFVVLSLVDVTDRRRAEDDLVRRAFIDPLTGLPNRRALTERLQHALAVSGRRQTAVGLLHLDIDRFTAVNDSLGHEGGDQLLCQVADRLRWSTRVEDTAVRFGADEFLVLAEDVEDVEALRTLADRLLSVLDEPFHVGSREVTLSASVGMTLGSDISPEALLRQAHSALARAKGSGGRGRIELHDGDLTEGYVDQLQLETDLRHALESGELRLFYQPIVALSDEHLLGYEALIRWQHPTRGLLPPAAFLSAAEDNRLTSRLGAWVLHQACWDAAGWASDLRVHVNISARHLAEPGFVELVADALAQSGLAPERLELEITESTALFAADATLHAVDTVTETGVTLALDDFGTGYSAITALHRLPIHTLKIDRSFVADVVAEPATAALVQGLLQLGAGMGLQVIAEGIEDADQARWLLAHGCSMAQGYAFGRPAPLPAREFEDLDTPPDLSGLGGPPPAPAPTGGHVPAGPLAFDVPFALPADVLSDVDELDGVELGEPGPEPLGEQRSEQPRARDTWPQWSPGPGRGSAAVPELDSFTLPETGAIALPAPAEELHALETAAPGTHAPGTDAPKADAPEAEPDDAPVADAGFDPSVFRPSRAFLELRELLAANGIGDPFVPGPREAAESGDLKDLATDASDLSGLRPWLESFQQRLGPPRTGELPEVGRS